MSRLNHLIKGVWWNSPRGQNLKFYWALASDYSFWLILEDDTLRVLEESVNRCLDLSN